MGGGSSTEPPRKPSSSSEEEARRDTYRMLPKPWRKIDWTSEEKTRLMHEIITYKPPLESVPKVRVLFLGQIGAGKSSLFNSVNSVFRGHVRQQASVGVGETSETLKYRTYSVLTGSDRHPLPIIFCDTMGLEEREGACLKTEDVVNLIKGHVPDQYQFNPYAAMQPSTPGYIKHPSLKDQIHCVVFVVDGSNIEILPEKTEGKLKLIRQKAKELDVPQLIILTKVDEICPSLRENVSDVYRSQYVLKKMQLASLMFGVPLSLVLPVKNYCSKLDLKEDVDILLLMALRQMVQLSDSYFDNFHSDKSHTTNSSRQGDPSSAPGADVLLEKPWRSINWTTGERGRLMHEIITYKPPLESVQHVRALFLGQIGAGKSSFYNSVDSVFQGHVLSQAPVGPHGRSMTKKYRTYRVKHGTGQKALPIIFCDTMGLQERDETSLKMDDVLSIFKGHVPDGYQFNPNGAVQPNAPGYIKCPSLKDQIHCVVFVVDGSKVDILPPKMESKLKEIREKANELDLPQLVILTKVDEISSFLKENVSDMYKSQAVKQKMEEASRKLSIALSQIVPVKNYCSEVDLKDDVDILILLAVRQIMRFTQRYLDHFSSVPSPMVD